MKRGVFSLIIVLAFFVLFSAAVSAATFSATVNGNAFSSATGSYATASHCGGTVCSWIVGNQSIIGVTDSVFNGGSETWSFTMPPDFPPIGTNGIKSAKLTVQWPGVYGKGLHSLRTDGYGTVQVNANVVATTSVNPSIRCGNDYFANSCSGTTFTYSIPWNVFSRTNYVTLSTPSGTVWDISKVTLTIEYTPFTYINNAACGTVSIPSSMTSGQEATVFVDMLNTSSDPNNWYADNGFMLGSQDPQDNAVWGTNRVSQVCYVPLSQCSLSNTVKLFPQNFIQDAGRWWYRFYFKVKAPQVSSTTSVPFKWRMIQEGKEWFGATCGTYVTVKPVVPAAINNSICGTVSAPSTMTAGQEYNVFVDLANTGNTSWDVSGNYRLGSQSPQDNSIWGFNRVSKVCTLPWDQCSLSNVVDLKPANTVPGSSNWYRFFFKVKAPSTAGTYDFKWKMIQGLNWFGATCGKTINVTANSSNNSACGTIGIPSNVTAGQEYNVFVDLANTGTSQWSSAGNYFLASQNSSWGFNSGAGVGHVCITPWDQCSLSNVVDLKPANTVPGTGNWYRFYFTIKAPSTSGNYNFAWRMAQGSTQFGAVCQKTIGVQQASSNVTISHGKVHFNGVEFFMKGIDYAPWLLNSGPDPTQQSPFPGEFDDVTYLVTNGGVAVTDYSGDGKIQTWEVLRFDVEKMKTLGINTIRTYASGSWHDKDLDGVIDYSSDPNVNEIVQGDLQDWALDRILMYAQQNNMKVIIGYWVQEEDFKQTPLVVDWDDLKVAKQAFGRVVNKYKNNPSVLAWGIGNEVSGSWNQGWFSWGVPVNDYLNQLNSYVRTLDTKHPIIYAKWVGENANFNNLNADIISVNTYTNSVQDMYNAGEFSIPVPEGKAYMLGEYGHLLSQATDHWNLAKQYAGGAFLEFNNVWWKGSGHDVLGTVDAYRAVNPDRYNALKALYSGS